MQSLEERLRGYAEQLSDAVPAVTMQRLESAESGASRALHDSAARLRLTRGLRRTPGVLLAAVVTVAFVAFVVAGGLSSSNKHTPQPGHHPVGPPLESISMPVGYQGPVGLAVSPLNKSVWFWATSPTKLSLFNWVPGTRSMRAITLGSPAELGCRSGNGAVAVDATGTVWIACGRELIWYATRTGRTSELTLPTVTSSFPGGLAAQDEFVVGLAPEAGGKVAIAIRDGGQVLILDAGNRRFSKVNLPRLTSPVGIAYSPSGTLALALIAVNSPESNSGVFEITASGLTHFVHVTEPIAVVASGDSFLVEPGLLLVTGERVSEFASASTVAEEDVNVAFGPLAAGGGRVFVGTESGLAVLGTHSVATVALPLTSECPAGSPGGPPPSGSPQSSSLPKRAACAQTALDLVATSAGGVYFTAWSPGAKLEYLPPSFDSRLAAFKFVPKVSSTMTFGACNLVISPAPTTGTAADADRAFAAYPGPYLGVGGTIVPGQDVQPVVEYADLSDSAYGPVVNGKVQPIFSDTQEWIIEYPSVRMVHPAAYPGASSYVTTETIFGIVSPGSFAVLQSDSC